MNNDPYGLKASALFFLGLLILGALSWIFGFDGGIGGNPYGF